MDSQAIQVEIDEKMSVMLRQIRRLLPKTDEFMAIELPWAVERYINQLGLRAGDPVAAQVKVPDVL